MNSPGSYGQFCPVAMAAEIVCSRWTALIVRELLAGSSRFNDLRRGVPRMSPSLLSKRLKDLEQSGVISSRRDARNGGVEYHLTPAGLELRGVVMSLGAWGQRWIHRRLSLQNLDASLLMWDMRRNLNPTPLPPRRCSIEFRYPELPATRQRWWLVIDKGSADLCATDPGFEVDLYVTSSLRSMTAIWMGYTTVRAETSARNVELRGDKALGRSMQQWLGLSPLASENRRAAA